MADEEQFEDDAEEGTEEDGGGKSKPRLLIILIIILVLAGGGGAYYFFKGGAPEGEAAEADAEAEGDDVAEEEKLATPYYFSLDPPFVVNFAGKSRAKFLQVNIGGLTRDPGIKEDITTHLPHIRNNVVFILSSQRYEDLISPEGKENLRKQVLSEIRNILKKETGKGDVEDIYFTSFVMQ